MPSKTKEKALAVAEATNGAAEAPTLNAEGFPVTSGGEVDKRFKYAPGTRPEKSSTPGQTRQEKMTALLSDHSWEFVGEAFNAEGVKSITGAALKRYFTIRNTGAEFSVGDITVAAGGEVIVGRGEMIKYAGVTPPRKQRASKEVEGEFAEAFEEGGEDAPAAAATDFIGDD